MFIVLVLIAVPCFAEEQTEKSKIQEYGTGAIAGLAVAGLIKIAIGLSNKKEDKSEEKAIKSEIVNIIAALNKLKSQVDETYHYTKDMHLWHSKEDEDGSKIWYNKRIVQRLLEENVPMQQDQAKLLEQLVRQVNAQTELHAALKDLVVNLYEEIKAKRGECPFSPGKEKVSKSTTKEYEESE